MHKNELREAGFFVAKGPFLKTFNAGWFQANIFFHLFSSYKD